jgi:hypothetical protein
VSKFRAEVKRDIAQFDAKLERFDTKLERLDTKLDTKVESLSHRLERDFRVLFGVIISVALGLGGLIAKSAGWLH